MFMPNVQYQRANVKIIAFFLQKCNFDGSIRLFSNLFIINGLLQEYYFPDSRKFFRLYSGPIDPAREKFTIN